MFDSHSSKEAAKFARDDRLWELIEEAFVALHHEMEPLRSECTIVSICSGLRVYICVNTLLMKEATDGFLKKLQTATLVTPSDALRCNQHPIAASSLTIGDKDEM